MDQATVKDSRPIYLDYNATTPVDNEVLEVIMSTLKNCWGNASSSYEAGQRAKSVIDKSRKQVADSVNALPSDIVFVSGGTEANNWVISTAIEHFRKHRHTEAGDGVKPHIVVTTVEHDAILIPAFEYSRKGLIDLTSVPVNLETGYVTAEDVAKAIRPNTCLVSVIMANNETGTIMPIKEISEEVRKNNGQNILIHTDAAQALGKIKVDVSELGVDYLTLVGHKFYGPRIGALYVRGLGEKGGAPLYPIFYGGSQERKYRPGTENTPMIAGLGKAAAIASKNLKEFSEIMLETRNYLEKRLLEEFGDKVVFNCVKAPRLPNTSSASFSGIDCEGYKLIQRISGFNCSTGSACHSSECKPSQVLLNFHVLHDIAANTLRFSTGRGTSLEEIDNVIRELCEIIPHKIP